MDHFCILFLREKDGGEPPQPSRAVVSIATKSRVSRQCYKQNSRRDLPTAGPRHERRTTYRWGISRYGFNRNLVAGIAGGVTNKTQGARCGVVRDKIASDAGGHCPLPSRG